MSDFDIPDIPAPDVSIEAAPELFADVPDDIGEMPDLSASDLGAPEPAEAPDVDLALESGLEPGGAGWDDIPEITDTGPSDPGLALEHSGTATTPELAGQSSNALADATTDIPEPSAESAETAQTTDQAGPAANTASADSSQPEVAHVPEGEEVQNDELQPNAIYEKNGYEFQTDELGRPSFVSGKLELHTGERSKLQTEVGKLGLPSDEGGHLIGTRFDGPTDAFNLVPQDMNLNRGAWKTMENDWAEALEAGQEVEFAIQPAYLDDDPRRPFGFDVLYTINDQQFTKSFYNESSKVG